MDDKLKIHIVDSVKGGSGKSTFSTKLALRLKSEHKNPCIVDLDLLGTSWCHIYANFSNIHDRNRFVFLNDLINDFEYYQGLEYLNEIKFSYNVNEQPVAIPVIFCNPDPRAKKLFKATEDNGLTNVTYSFFFEGIQKIVKLLADRGFTDIIFDMPPNSEQYSDGVLNYYLKISRKVDAYLYMVSSLNLAHIMSTFDWYSDFFKKSFSSKHVTVLPHHSGVSTEGNNAKHNFIFNDVNNIVSTLGISNAKEEVKNIVRIAEKTVADQLKFHLVDFDSSYMVSTTPLYKTALDVIKCNAQYEDI